MRFINLTPHIINVYTADKELVLSVPSDGVARCATVKNEVGMVDGVPLFETTYGEVTGLPAFDPDAILIVSLLVRQAVPKRIDVFSPGELLRDDSGQPIGCIGLSR